MEKRRRSYRIDEPRPRPKQRSMQDVITPGTVVMTRGVTTHLAIPCFYQEAHFPVHAHPHDRMRHDMLGWPTPEHPDHVCQEWDFDRHCCRRTPHMKFCPPTCERFVDLGRLFPVHLTKEGYTEVNVMFEDNAETFEYDAYIDEEDDWIVRVDLYSDISMGIGVRTETSMAVYVGTKMERDSKSLAQERNDLVALMRLVVLPTIVTPDTLKEAE